MLVSDSRQLAEAAQHHLEELLEDEGTSKYSFSDDDDATNAHCIEIDNDGSVDEVRQLDGGNRLVQQLLMTVTAKVKPYPGITFHLQKRNGFTLNMFQSHQIHRLTSEVHFHHQLHELTF